MLRPAALLALWLPPLLLASCDGCESRSEPTPPPATPRPAVEPTPAEEPSGAPERVTFSTTDGVTLVGTLRPGGHPEAPAVVLVHQLSSSRQEWDPIVARLAEPPGLTTLAIDLRGHGESTSGPDGQALAWRDFDNEAWAAITTDVTAAVDYLLRHPALHPSKILAVGSSIGGSAVITAAARERRIAAMAMLSPGRAYRGIDAITPATEIGDRPLLLLTAEGEQHSMETARDLERIAARGALKSYPGEAHGVSIAAGSPQMIDDLVTFIRSGGGS